METISPTGEELIIEALKKKACTKQKVFRLTKEVFQEFKEVIKELAEELAARFADIDPAVEISYRDINEFEAELKFSGDVLYFMMHTNVFTFEENHEIYSKPYVQEEECRAYFGMIQIYNFLADSIKYNRHQDIGYMIGRIFLNVDGHFFVDGERQLGFLYNDLENAEMNPTYMKAIVETAVLYTLDFELLVPPFADMREITVLEKMEQSGVASLKTGKRLGFIFNGDGGKENGEN